MAKGKGGSLNRWRDWMPSTHAVVRQLAKEGELEITQRGTIVIDATSSVATKVRGPYRVRKREPS